MYQQYTEYCSVNKYGAYGQEEFSRRLSEVGFTKGRNAAGVTFGVYIRSISDYAEDKDPIDELPF
jgi:hypothetical protein